MEKVLFICTHNSARSQMAEGLFRHYYGTKYEVYSAGTQPSQINPYVVKAMAELGINISHYRAKHVAEFLELSIDHIVTEQ